MTDYDILTMIDLQPIACTDWEIEFLVSCLGRGTDYRLSPKQRAIVQRMADKYLAESIVLEWLGQMRLV